MFLGLGGFFTIYIEHQHPAFLTQGKAFALALPLEASCFVLLEDFDSKNGVPACNVPFSCEVVGV